jgi:hypothetical protein
MASSCSLCLISSQAERGIEGRVAAGPMKITLIITDFENFDIEEEIDVEEGDTVRVLYDREKEEFDWEVL